MADGDDEAKDMRAGDKMRGMMRGRVEEAGGVDMMTGQALSGASASTAAQAKIQRLCLSAQR